MAEDLNNSQGMITTIDKAVELCSITFGYQEITEILKGSDDVKKCIAIMNIQNIQEQSFADLFVYHLTNQGGTVREAVAIKLNDLLSQNKFVEFFQSDYMMEKIANGVVDINPNISRLIIDILDKIENKNFLINNFVEKIDFCLFQILECDVLQNHQINKYYFKIYWLLEALASFDDLDIHKILPLLEKIANLPEYTVREKVAILVKKYSDKIKDDKVYKILKDDVNYYVKRIFD